MSETALTAPAVLDDGLHSGVTIEEYLAHPAMSRSELLILRDQTPAQFQATLSAEKPDTAAFSIGHAVHAMLLEPGTFWSRYSVAPAHKDVQAQAKKLGLKAGGTTEAIRERITQETGEVWGPEGTTLLTQEQHDICQGIATGACMADPFVRELMSCLGENELTAISGKRKARIDRFIKGRDFSTLLDVKTAESAKPEAFSRSISKFGYDVQAAYYLSVMAELGALDPATARFGFLVLEKHPPYDGRVYFLDQRSIDMGRDTYKALLATYEECCETGVWPGYSKTPAEIGLPDWRFK